MELPPLEAQQPADLPGLHNVVTYAPGLYSGSVPEGPRGFETLAAMGVQTVISVDGALPDVESARAWGLRYVHLPIGYNGMGRERSLEIAKAIRDLPGPIYVHCHHGKHRSAAALGAAMVALGRVDHEQALARMQVSGTSPNYKGLFQCVREAAPATDQEWSAIGSDFPETYSTPPLVKAMVQMDEIHERLKQIQKAGWKVPPYHPDLVPAAEAGQLADLFRHLENDPTTASHPDDYRQLLKDSQRLASEIESGLIASAKDPARLTGLFSRLNQACKDCHRRFRD